MAGVPTSFTWRRAMTASDLPSTTKLVLFVIAEYASSIDDVCWPSLEELASRSSLNRRSVTDHLEIAERGGWIDRWKSKKGRRRWAHGHYRLTLPEDVARRLRDELELGLAAASGVEMERDSTNYPAESERGSESAQNLGKQEGDSSSEGAGIEGDSGSAQGMISLEGQIESWWNHVPTNSPDVSNNDSKSLYSAAPVYLGVEGTVRERDRQESVGKISELVEWMARELQASDPGAAPPPISDWTADVQAMLADGRSVENIVRLWRWAVRDGFWSTIIRSPARLRKNWESLRAKRNLAMQRKATPVSVAPTDAADDRICSHIDEHGQRCTHVATSILGAGSSRRGYCRQHVGIYE